MISMKGPADGNHWEGLQALLPAYRCITSVQVGDGASTSSWWDSWLGAFTLAVQFPCLLSHSTNKDVSVQQIIQLGISYNLTARLSSQATLELTEVQQLLASITLTQQPDRRTCKFADTTSKLNTGAIYRASTYSGVSSRIYNYVWTSRAPTRVRFFGWLLMLGRLQCRANLYYKHVLDDDICELCRQQPETSDHLIFHCTVAKEFWNHLGFQGNLPLPSTKQLWDMPRPPTKPPKHFNTMLLLCCWNIWNHRHDVVFRHQQPSLRRLLAACKEAARLWGCRLRQRDRHLVDVWCQMFVMH